MPTRNKRTAEKFLDDISGRHPNPVKRSGRTNREFSVYLLLRRLKQLSILHEHCLAVIAKGERPLSGKELWRVQNMASECSDRASILRGFDMSEPDVPGITEVE